MKNEWIKAIFTNLLFVIGVILLIFGFVRIVVTGTYLFVFEKYPLDQYQETMCDTNYAVSPIYAPEKGSEPLVRGETKEELLARKAKCEKQLEIERKVRMATDVSVAITTAISGAVLVYFFRRFIFGK
ncbi:hypothetical protein KA001_01590 [Patescibacteria group bacterium]|nr:hypothetical protein [Patescibacteria group bacterium]